MKKIEAIIRRTKFEEVKEALFNADINWFSYSEVKAIGRYLKLPDKLVDKVPIDGLCGKTDEENLGFTYDTLDKYIRGVEEPDEETRKIIDKKHKQNLFKLQLMPVFDPGEM